jgi:hypothetical protein
MLAHTKAFYLMRLPEGKGWLTVMFARAESNYDSTKKNDLNERVNSLLFGQSKIVYGDETGTSCTQSHIVGASPAD